MWINYQFTAVCPLILIFVHISSQKRLVFANHFGLPNFLPQLPNFFTRIYPSYPWHFPTLIGFAVNYYKRAFLVKCRVYKLNIVWWSGKTWKIPLLCSLNYIEYKLSAKAGLTRGWSSLTSHRRRPPNYKIGGPAKRFLLIFAQIPIY